MTAIFFMPKVVGKFCWGEMWVSFAMSTLQWRHNERDGVSSHLRPDCLLNRSFRRRTKKTSKLCVTGLCEWPVDCPHKGPVMKKMFPVDAVIMKSCYRLCRLDYHVIMYGDISKVCSNILIVYVQFIENFEKKSLCDMCCWNSCYI